MERKPCKIIKGYVVILCKDNKQMHRHFSLAGFVELVLLGRDAEYFGDLALGQIIILSHISETLIIIHNNSPSVLVIM